MADAAVDCFYEGKEASVRWEERTVGLEFSQHANALRGILPQNVAGGEEWLMRFRQVLRGIFFPPSPKPVHVSELIRAIQDAINEFYLLSKGLPPLSQVKLALQTVREGKLSGEAQYLVLAAKGYFDASATQEVDFTLKPAPTERSFRVAELVTDQLRYLIKSVQQEVKATYDNDGHLLTMDQIDVQISFALAWDVGLSVGADKWIVVPKILGLGGGVEYNSKTTHTITVTFARPQNAQAKPAGAIPSGAAKGKVPRTVARGG